MKTLVLASSNAGKIAEIKPFFETLSITLKSQQEFALEDVKETGLSFVENAILKARHAAEHTGLAALADDSGLQIDALDGAPGIYSARYAGSHGDSAANIAKVLSELKGVAPEKRSARFCCALALMRTPQDANPLIFQGDWEGMILEAPQGKAGFGYDPIFWVTDYARSAAQMDSALKNKISHRGQALAKLFAFLYNERTC